MRHWALVLAILVPFMPTMHRDSRRITRQGLHFYSRHSIFNNVLATHRRAAMSLRLQWHDLQATPALRFPTLRRVSWCTAATSSLNNHSIHDTFCTLVNAL